MKSKIFVFLFFTVVCASFRSYPQNMASKKDETTSLDDAVLLADPFIMLYEGTYYAYGTTNGNKGFDCFLSKDLKIWEKNKDLILNSQKTLGSNNFWAPEVFYDKKRKRFFLYYTANYEIWVAESSSPLGPFFNPSGSKQPLMMANSIDASPFINNKFKLLFFRQRNPKSSEPFIYYVKLNDDLISIKPNSQTLCFGISQNWEGENVMEGPYVIKYKNWYILFYSSNRFQSENYGIGYAYSKSPFGPWIKSDQNPLIQHLNFNGTFLQGTGHNCVFKDKKGNFKIAFHAHKTPGIGDPRILYIGDLNIKIKNEIPVLSISNIIRPKLIQN